MTDRRASTVVPMRRCASAVRARHAVGPTHVLHAVADGDGVVESASVIAALEERDCFSQLVVHACGGSGPVPGADVALPGAHRRFGVGHGTHGQRTAATLTAFEALLMEEWPDLVVVAGDDDGALAAALAAAKLGIAVAHLGSGLRCRDWTQPEEVNRCVIDRLADTLFAYGDEAVANLRAEGVPDGRIHLVGNTRIDTLRRYEADARQLAAWHVHGMRERRYTLVVLRRRASLEPEARLERVAEAVAGLARAGDVMVLLDARTRALLEDAGTLEQLAASGARCAGPLCYVESLSLHAGAGQVVTDIEAVQEEASALGVACYTLRHVTAGTVTLTGGTNVLLGDDPAALAAIVPSRATRKPAVIPLWDGRAGERVADALARNYTLADAYVGSP